MRLWRYASLLSQQSCGLFKVAHFNHDARALELVNVAKLDGNHTRFEIGALRFGIEVRFDGRLIHDFKLAVAVGAGGLVRVVLEAETRFLPLGFVLVLHDGQRLAIFRQKVLVPHFPVGVLHFGKLHAELFRNPLSHGHVVVGIDDADFASHFPQADFADDLSALDGVEWIAHTHFHNGRAARHGNETASGAVGLEETEHFKLAAELDYRFIFHIAFLFTSAILPICIEKSSTFRKFFRLHCGVVVGQPEDETINSVELGEGLSPCNRLIHNLFGLVLPVFVCAVFVDCVPLLLVPCRKRMVVFSLPSTPLSAIKYAIRFAIFLIVPICIEKSSTKIRPIIPKTRAPIKANRALYLP
jgi:hypothetical protein